MKEYFNLHFILKVAVAIMTLSVVLGFLGMSDLLVNPIEATKRLIGKVSG